MGARFRSWWQKVERPFLVVGKIAVFLTVLLVAIALIFVEIKANGTGFAGKTLWDWLQLLAALAIPVVVGFGAVWFTTRQGKVADAENTDNQRETALQAYIDKMSELMLVHNLLSSTEKDEVRTIARVRTITILHLLDARRIGYVFSFLCESGLMSAKSKESIVSLGRANLRYINFSGAEIAEADFRRATLQSANLFAAFLANTNFANAMLIQANLSCTSLINANLSGADLQEANLGSAVLSGANLKDAKVTPEQLATAESLKGATMPDGSIYP